MRGHPAEVRIRRFVGVAAAAALVASGVVVGATSAQASGTPSIYAAPDGTGNVCSAARPCALPTAQQVARTRNTALSSDLVVQLAGGTYRLDAPLNFTSADSGSNGHRVIYRAAPGTNPVISGGRQITGWTIADASRNLWSAPVPANLDTRQLYVNGVRAEVAQGPSPVALTRTANDTGYTAADASMASWRNPSGLEFVFTGTAGAWEETRCRVASIAGTTITMRQPCWDNSIYHSTGLSGHPSGTFSPLPAGAVPTRIEDAFELLTKPGQWYLDPSAHRVYYLPTAGQNMATVDVEAPVLQSLVNGAGTVKAPVHDLTFAGITFAYQTWLRPSGDDGYSDMQSGHTLTGANAYARQGVCDYTDPPGSCPYASWTQTPGALSWSAARNVTFTGDTLTHLGSAGLFIGAGSAHDLVTGNDFTDISGTGIELGNVDDAQPADATEITSNNTISDNWIHDVASEYHDEDGIYLGYTRGTTVTHNQLDDLPWDGIDIGFGGWTTNAFYPLEVTNVNQDNVLSDNLIYDYHQVLSDGGGIYSNGREGTSWAHGLTETGNVIYNQINSGFVYYPDQGSAWVTITGNADWSVNGSSFGGCAPVGDLKFDDNYYGTAFDPTVNICPPTPINVEATGNHQIANTIPAPGEVPDALLAGAGLRPQFRGVLPLDVEAFSGQGSTTTAATRILVSGSGFTPRTTVAFGKTVAGVAVLSANFLVATVPAGVLLDQITVGTAAGSITFPRTYPSLAASFNDVGTTDDATPGDGNIDGYGYSYSVQALDAAGAASGAPVGQHGLTFTWPLERDGVPDNTIADGQLVSMSGTGNTLGFLFVGVTNTPPMTGTGSVVYTDGTAQAFTLSSPNWYGNPPAGADAPFVLPYRNSAGGPDHNPVAVYYQGVPLATGKTIASVVLPVTGSGPDPALHIFAMAVGNGAS
ncbi:MAG TPA: right-handed parallel beta-helix repeat-containing protein [Pseudonocardiaceae bacterium]|nr:right-handed parallel beta-helix repeat-containing protein [Pseudonocardiaceae bacterium]